MLRSFRATDGLPLTGYRRLSRMPQNHPTSLLRCTDFWVSAAPGSIRAVELSGGEEFIVRRGGFLAASPSVEPGLSDAQQKIDAFRWDYNDNHPHRALKGLSSNEYARRAMTTAADSPA